MVRPDLKEKIQSVATKLGYKPDPALAALVAYRTGHRQTQALSNLALLVPTSPFRPRATNPRTCYFDSHLRQAAEKLGYCMDLIEIPDEPRAQAAVQRMLLARGIRGLVLSAEFVSPRKLQLDWSHFACVQILNFHSDHFHHAISRNEHLDMTKIMEEIQNHGFSRPAFVMGTSAETPHFSLKVAIFETALVEMGVTKPKDYEFLYPLGYDWEKGEFSKWVKKRKPDVIISDTADWTVEFLSRQGHNVPKDIGFISTCVPFEGSSCSGIKIDVPSQTQLCMDILHGQLLRGEVGLPDIPMAVELRGLWQSGTTLDNRTKASPNTACNPAQHIKTRIPTSIV